ncbi:MAG: tyrosine-type recombinase/integrase [Bacteroidetes bacterium]|nr:tyrosine-type recombinase/integrase [Bacteroidota bacterium]
MKGNTISLKTLNESGNIWLQNTLQLLVVQEYGKGSVRNYMQELTLLFKHYNDLQVEDLRQQHIERYLVFIKENHKVGRAKCRSVAQACSFFFKKVMPVDYIVPNNLYPKKQFKLPNIMTEMQVEQLFQAPLHLLERCVLGLLYGCGLRISEVCNLKINDIDSSNKRIKVEQGKGGKDRFTLLPPTLLEQLRQYYVAAGKPKEYLFTSSQTKRALHVRSMQVVVNKAMEKAGFESGRFTAHTLRHSFATHMLNQGNNIHVIKTLLGHSKLETTMIYLHLQHHTQMGIVSPLEKLGDGTSGN